MKSKLHFLALFLSLVWMGCPATPDTAGKVVPTPEVPAEPCMGAGALGAECRLQCPLPCEGCGCNGHFLGCVCQCVGCNEPPLVVLAPNDRLDAVQRILQESDASAATDMLEKLEEIRRRAAVPDEGIEQLLLGFEQQMMLLDADTLERLMALGQQE